MDNKNVSVRASEGSLDNALRVEVIGLIEQAFAEARRKKGRPQTAMDLSVLNNRLLQMTNRTFSPSRYGASSLVAVLQMLSPRVVIRKDGRAHTVVELGKADSSSPSTLTSPATPQGRIREDLWRAIVDYASGIEYLWDSTTGTAVPKGTQQTGHNIPTLTFQELQGWRAEFVRICREQMSPADYVLALRWLEQGLPTSQLPPMLQGAWNRHMTAGVRDRIDAFFASLQEESPSSERAAYEALQDDYAAAREKGENFLAGEILARSLRLVPEEEIATVLAAIITCWAIPRGAVLDIKSMTELVSQIDALSSENASTAFVGGLARLQELNIEVPGEVGDLSFKLKASIARIFQLDDRKAPMDVCRAAIAKLQNSVAALEEVVGRFRISAPATAKASSLELVKTVHSIYPQLVSAERGFLREIDVLLGPAFRRLFEAYEKGEDLQVIRRGPELLQDLDKQKPTAGDPRLHSRIWNTVVAPTMAHITEITGAAMSRGAAALAPSLAIINPRTKADLRNHQNRVTSVCFALRNSGAGHAYDVALSGKSELSFESNISLLEPAGAFDIAPGGEQLVRIRVQLREETDALALAVSWHCRGAAGSRLQFDDVVHIEQQVTEPNWDALISDPPYSINPVRRADRLYGRDGALASLKLAAMAGASTFVWGQKRIGKTSVLQVLANELGLRTDTTCVLLRMGELAALHEGEIARLIACRLTEACKSQLPIPSEAEFGAGLGRLISFVENLEIANRGRKFVVIIDEFDDIDPSFYIGERGKQFVKALRSVSEVGLTFFFVGSERMEAIYRRHQTDLNKWTNTHLDRIDSRSDCASLITAPVRGAIEYSVEAVDFIIQYCDGNPFYMHNFCYRVFERCLKEHRTFVDDTDTDAVRRQLLNTLGPSNFAHLWDDNPVLDVADKRKASAENCVALACISALGGKYETLDELIEIQESFATAAEQRAGGGTLRRACERLVNRGVLTQREGAFVIRLQVFREWLSENALSRLLPVWTDFKSSEQVDVGVPSVEIQRAFVEPNFVIPEDEVLAVSQRLVFHGRQKDAADIRIWLRQFDDDSRIEVGFLLLKRLADRGFVNEGARSLALSKLEEMIRARRLEVGRKLWKVERGRLDNLCITYVDSELKSGASLARELRNMMRPGKGAAAPEASPWMRSHLEDDPLVAVVDDFAGTGSGLAKGLVKFREQTGVQIWDRYVAESRVGVFLMFAFPEALEKIRAHCPGVQVFCAHVLGDELRACSDESGIFGDAAELRFAKEVLLQTGRELFPECPLGYGDMGVLFAFHNQVPNNTLPIFWSNGTVGERPWRPLFPRG